MGGNAIKESSRMEKKKFEQFCQHFHSLLQNPIYAQFVKDSLNDFPKAYREKESFGDIDFLSTQETLDFFRFILELENQQEIKIQSFQAFPSLYVHVNENNIEALKQLHKNELCVFIDNDNVPTEPEINKTYSVHKMTEQGFRTIMKLEKENNLKVTEKEDKIPTYSFGIQIKENQDFSNEIYQFDYIKTNKNIFDFHYNYLCWNDLGNFIGRIAAFNNMKFGQDGLFKIIYYDNNGKILSDVSKIKDKNNQQQADKAYKKTLFPISDNFNQSLEFLGFDSKTFEKGFNNLEEIATFVYQSKYFNNRMFDLENRDNKSRARDLKRPNYAFVTDCFNKWDEKSKQDGTFDEKQKDLNQDIGICFPDYVNRLRQFRKNAKTECLQEKRFQIGKVIAMSEKCFGIVFSPVVKRDKTMNDEDYQNLVQEKYNEVRKSREGNVLGTVIVPNELRKYIRHHFENVGLTHDKFKEVYHHCPTKINKSELNHVFRTALKDFYINHLPKEYEHLKDDLVNHFKKVEEINNQNVLKKDVKVGKGVKLK